MARGDSYEEFTRKFERKKTTDDCITPKIVYDSILDWVCDEYGAKKENVVRPFWPDSEYTEFEYDKNCVVVDNPPFSILAEIIKFYVANNIKFFLFANGLTSLNNKAIIGHGTIIITDTKIEYDNGAKVNTSFVTNLGDPDVVAKTEPELAKKIIAAIKEFSREKYKQFPVYHYPANVLTIGDLLYLARHGISFSLGKNECIRINALDAQKEQKKAIFGCGFLLSEKAAAEKAAAEKAAAEKAAAEKAAAAAEKKNGFIWQLSSKEKQLIADLSK